MKAKRKTRKKIWEWNMNSPSSVVLGSSVPVLPGIITFAVFRDYFFICRSLVCVPPTCSSFDTCVGVVVGDDPLGATPVRRAVVGGLQESDDLIQNPRRGRGSSGRSSGSRRGNSSDGGDLAHLACPRCRSPSAPRRLQRYRSTALDPSAVQRQLGLRLAPNTHTQDDPDVVLYVPNRLFNSTVGLMVICQGMRRMDPRRACSGHRTNNILHERSQRTFSVRLEKTLTDAEPSK